MFLKTFETLKYKFIRYFERNYRINLLIYNNIHLLKFLLPHEKDYYGMLLVCRKKKNNVILDIGGSLGISSLGFRRLGFKNIIYIFEPNNILFKKFLKKNIKGYKDIFLKNYALGKSNKTKIMYMPFYNSKCIHYFCSFDLKYLLNSIKITFPKILNKISIKTTKIKCKKYDDLKLNIKPHFIKIDTEGFDQYVLLGMKKTIRKFKPIFLVEYNKKYFNNVRNILYDYVPYIYDFSTNKMTKIPKKINHQKISRTNKNNFLSIRNIYFIHKNRKIA